VRDVSGSDGWKLIQSSFYEGHTMPIVTFATRVCKRLGIQVMLGNYISSSNPPSNPCHTVTNAAGGLNPSYNVGDIVVVNDVSSTHPKFFLYCTLKLTTHRQHINIAGFVGVSPLRGPNEDDFGTRFPPMSDAYDLVLRRLAHKTWSSLGPLVSHKQLHEGVYAFVAGPSYETRAECRFLRVAGADLVGMSTVPEVVVARHSGIKVLAFSLVTNKCVLDAPVAGNDPRVLEASSEELDKLMKTGSANHEEVLAAGQEAAKVMQIFVKQIVEGLGNLS
jgi:purine-nucleoside phosphorylase